MRSELNYAGKNLSEFGMWFDNSKVYKKPSKRFMGYDIPARNGTLYQSENKFNNVIIEFDCFIKDNFDQNYNDLVNYLNSFETYQKLVNSYNGNMYRMALFHEAIEVDTGQFLKDGRFKLFFDCKPQEYYADGAEFERIASHYDTYTGNPVVLVNEGESTVTNLKVALNPQQNLNGYDSPWIGGAGKNKLKTSAATQTINGVTFTINDDGTVSLSGTSTARANFSMPLSVPLVDGDYTLSGCPSGGSGTTYYQQAFASSGGRGVDVGNGVAVVSPASEITRIVITVRNADINTDGLVFKPMIRLSTETDDSFEPYENICPITGHTSASVTRTGKNLFHVTREGRTNGGITYTADTSANVIHASGTATAASYAYSNGGWTWANSMLLKAGTYTASMTEVNGARFTIYEVLESGGVNNAPLVGLTSSPATFTLTEDTHIGFQIRIENGTTVDGTLYIQIESGNTSTEYEPYTGNTYTIDLNGTVYGGTVDLVTGVLTLTKGFKNITASDNIQSIGSSGHGWQVLRTSFDDPPVNTGANYSDGVYCDRLKSEVGASSVADDLCFINSSGVLRFNTTAVYADKTALFNALGEINVAYPIEPQTYSLSRQTIDILIGDNYISSSGEVTVITLTPLILRNPSPMTAKPTFKFTNISAPFTVSANGETIISFQNAIRLIKHTVANNMTFDANGTALTVTKTGTPAYTETSILINSGYLPAGRYSFSSATLGSLEVRSADGTQTYSSGGTFTLTDFTQVKIWYVITPSASTPQTFSMPIFLRPLGTLYVDSELMDCYMLDGDTAYSFNECVSLPKDFLQLDERTVVTMTSGAFGFIAPNWWRL